MSLIPLPGDTLVYVNAEKNVTLNLPEPVLHRFKIHAASHRKPMSSLMTDAVDELIAQRSEKEARKSRFLERIRNAPGRGIGGRITWTRDALHER
jgi:hypothetical protein